MNDINDNGTMMIVEGLNINRVSDSIQKISQFQKVVQSTLTENIDYGAAFIGSKKPSLLKPGAEKILMLLGLSSSYEIIERIQDYDEGFFAYTIKCTLLKGNTPITEGLGHCNSKERKYDGEKQDKFMLGNTCLKMAKKRAQVDATLTVGSLSNIFTQDLEDMVQFEAEELKTMTLAEAEKLKIGFGRHKGKTIGEIYKSAPDYVEWLSDKSTDPNIKKAAEVILNSSNGANNAQKSNDKNQENKLVVDEETGEIFESDQEELPWK